MSPPRHRRPARWLQPTALALGGVPLAYLIWGAITDALGPNPAEALIRGTGDWALRGLCLTLAVTPMRVWSGWPAWASIRRTLGLWTFAYACLHLLAFAWLDMGLVWADIVRDIAKRPFILVGTLCWLLLLPLALTSFNRAIKALGARRWQVLHRLVYAVAPLAVLHMFWMRAAKQRFEEVVVYALVLGTLLAWRGWHRWRRRDKA